VTNSHQSVPLGSLLPTGLNHSLLVLKGNISTVAVKNTTRRLELMVNASVFTMTIGMFCGTIPLQKY
jgi:hypothetical protein